MDRPFSEGPQEAIHRLPEMVRVFMGFTGIWMDRLHHDTPKKWTGISLRVSLHNPLKGCRFLFATSLLGIHFSGYCLARFWACITPRPDTQSNIARK